MASMSNRMKTIADQVEFHAEALARRTGGGDAAFIGRVFDLVLDAFPDQEGSPDQAAATSSAMAICTSTGK